MTSEPIDAKASVHTWAQVAPMEMSYASPVSPTKTHKLEATVAGKTLSHEFTAQPAMFETVLVYKDKIESFSSGNSLSSAKAGLIDLVNLTSKPLSFKVGAQEETIEPRTSKSVEVGSGSVPVTIKGAEAVNAELTPAQIWAVYALEENGKTVLKGLTLKGTGAAAAAGGPSG